MILAVSATDFEMNPMLEVLPAGVCDPLVSGVGLLETCLQLTRHLQNNSGAYSLVVHFGIAGAFPAGRDPGPTLLDICLAATEVNGDFGICYPLRIDDFREDMATEKKYVFDVGVTDRAQKILRRHGITFFIGNFVSVNSTSGTRRRGEILRDKYEGLCENMEGAAVARVCREFFLPCLEIRCISNYVEDRDRSSWRLQEACQKGGHTAALVIKEMGDFYGTV